MTMNYEEKCVEMMLDLGKHYTPENFQHLIESMAMAIARTVALIADHDDMHKALESLCDAMHAEACQEHRNLNGLGPKTVDHETFLRDYYKPGATND